MKRSNLLPVLIATLIAVPGIANATDKSNNDKTGTCLSLTDVGDTPVVNDNTILIQMRDHKVWKRIDLQSKCPDLEIYGFVHDAHNNSLCTSDFLRVREEGGMTCVIGNITDITADQAKTLLAQKKWP